MLKQWRFSTPRVAGLICAATLFTLSLPALQALACACCGTYRVVNVANWDVLNVRSGPGVSYQIVQKLQHDEGCILPKGERQGAWVRIEFNGISGWANSYYLAITR